MGCPGEHLPTRYSQVRLIWLKLLLAWELHGLSFPSVSGTYWVQVVTLLWLESHNASQYSDVCKTFRCPVLPHRPLFPLFWDSGTTADLNQALCTSRKTHLVLWLLFTAGTAIFVLSREKVEALHESDLVFQLPNRQSVNVFYYPVPHFHFSSLTLSSCNCSFFLFII